MKLDIQKIKLFIISHKNPLFLFGIFCLYLGLIIFGAAQHEPWRDEAQSWLIARDLGFGDILKQMSAEGTPALWHLIIAPFAKLGLPYYWQLIVHLIIAAVSAGLLLFYAPFSKITKISLLFSYYFAYEYAVIARNYNLTILILFLIAAGYQSRFKKPILYSGLIFLLFNTNVHSFLAAAALAVLWLWETHQKKIFDLKKYLAGLMMFLGGVLAVAQLLPKADDMARIMPTIDPYFVVSGAVANALFPGGPADFSFFIFTFTPLMLYLFMVIFSFLKKIPLLFLGLSTGWLFYIFIFKYSGSYRHHGLILVFLIFALWINHYYSPHQPLLISNQPLLFSKTTETWRQWMKYTVLVILNLCLLFSCLYTIKIYSAEYKYNFSGSKDMADFIAQNNYNKKYKIIGFDSTATEAVLPYLPKTKLWYPEFEDYGTFIKYNKKFSAFYYPRPLLDQKQAIAKIKQFFPDQSKILILLAKSLDNPDSFNLKLIHASGSRKFWASMVEESYWLYGSKDNPEF